MHWHSAICVSSVVLVCAQLIGQEIPPSSYTATLYRDELGIGHVHAADDNSVAYGLGRLVARDHPLRTMWALTVPTGRLAEVIGSARGSDLTHWEVLDRMTRAYRVPEFGAGLWFQYVASAQQEDQEIRNLIVAYLEGIKDQINEIGSAALAAEYAALSQRADWPYGNDLKLNVNQYQRLFDRVTGAPDVPQVQQWEVFAAVHYWLGRVTFALGRDPDQVDGAVGIDELSDFFGLARTRGALQMPAQVGTATCRRIRTIRPSMATSRASRAPTSSMVGGSSGRVSGLSF